MVHKGLILVGVPLLTNVLFFVILMSLLQQTDSELQRELRSRQVVGKAGQLVHLYYSSLESIVIASKTGDPYYVKRFDTDVPILQKELGELKALVNPNSQQAPLVQRLEENSKRLIAVLMEIRRSGADSLGLSDMQEIKDLARLKHMVSQVSEDLSELAQSETRALAQGSSVDAARKNIAQFVTVGVASNIVLAVFLTMFFSRTVTARLDQLSRASVRLIREEPLGPVSPDADEIGELNRTIHQVSHALADARRKERALIANAADVICSLSESGVFVKVNPASAPVWGFPPGDLVDRRVQEFVTDASQLNFRQDTLTTFEAGFVHQSGSIVDTFWSANWSTDDKLYFCVARDISQKKQAERLKQQLIDMVSHDLRTPLTSINNVLSLMAMETYGPLSDKALNKLQIAQAESGRLINLVNNLLDYERLEGGQLHLDLHSVDPGDLIARCILSMSDLAAKKSIKLEPDIQTNVNIELDENRIVQVLINLIANAIKFSKNDTSITVSIKQESNGVTFGVQDQGPGISEADQGRLFNRFSQLRETNAADGAGLGLAICKQIVELHNGKIGVTSDGKSGSYFWFSLPLGNNAEAVSLNPQVTG